MIVAEHAHGDGTTLVARPTHDAIAAITRSTVRTVERQFAELVELGWLRRVGPRARTGVAQTYQLVAPSDVETRLIDAAYSLAPGMWSRLVEREPDKDVGHETDTDVGRSDVAARRGLLDSPTREAQQPDADVGPTGPNRINRTAGDARDMCAAGTPKSRGPNIDAMLALHRKEAT